MWVLKKVQNHYLGIRVFLLWKSTINVYFFMQLDFDELKWDLLFHFFCKITSKSYSTIQAFFGFSCRHLSSCCFDNKLISDYLQVFRQGYVMLQCAQIEHYTIPTSIIKTVVDEMSPVIFNFIRSIPSPVQVYRNLFDTYLKDLDGTTTTSGLGVTYRIGCVLQTISIIWI